MATTDEIRSTIDQYVERFSAGDSARWAGLFSADAVHEDPVGTPVNHGRDAVQAFYDNTSALFGGNLRIDLIAEPVIVTNEAIVMLTATGGEGPHGFDHVAPVVERDGLDAEVARPGEPLGHEIDADHGLDAALTRHAGRHLANGAKADHDE